MTAENADLKKFSYLRNPRSATAKYLLQNQLNLRTNAASELVSDDRIKSVGNTLVERSFKAGVNSVQRSFLKPCQAIGSSRKTGAF